GRAGAGRLAPCRDARRKVEGAGELVEALRDTLAGEGAVEARDAERQQLLAGGEEGADERVVAAGGEGVAEADRLPDRAGAHHAFGLEPQGPSGLPQLAAALALVA